MSGKAFQKLVSALGALNTTFGMVYSFQKNPSVNPYRNIGKTYFSLKVRFSAKTAETNFWKAFLNFFWGEQKFGFRFFGGFWGC